MENKTQHKNVLKALAAIVLAAVVAGVICYLAIGRGSEEIEGKIDADEYRVECKADAQILEIRVKEGDYVHVGDTLAILEVSDAEAKTMADEPSQQAATATGGTAQNGVGKAQDGVSKEQVKTAYEMWQQAKAGLETQQKAYERAKRLYDKGQLSEQERDEAYINLKVYQAQEKTAKRQYDMAVSSMRGQGKGATAARYGRTKGAAQDEAAYIVETAMTASVEGEVSAIYAKAGDGIRSGAQVMSISMLKDCWSVFNISEKQLNGLKTGDTFMAYLPAFSKELQFKVYQINVQGGKDSLKDTKPSEQKGGTTYVVKARPVQQFDGLRPDMLVVIRGTLNEKK